jgi:hypothetical protein
MLGTPQFLAKMLVKGGVLIKHPRSKMASAQVIVILRVVLRVILRVMLRGIPTLTVHAQMRVMRRVTLTY